MKKILFGFRPHRGGLDESMKEMEYISDKAFNKLLPNYEFYAFDDRVSQLMFLLKDIEHNYKTLPEWLFIEIR